MSLAGAGAGAQLILGTTLHMVTPHLDTGDLMPPATPGLSWEVTMRAEQLVAAARPPSHHWSQQTSLTTLHSSLHHTAAAAATNTRHCYGAGPGDVMSDAGIIPTFTHLYCSTSRCFYAHIIRSGSPLTVSSCVMVSLCIILYRS